MIYNFDLKFDTIEEQKTHINNIAKKYNLTPLNKNSAPYLYTRNGKGMPIMYQYKYINSHVLPHVDLYIYYLENNHVWSFADGGEDSKTGWKFPFEPPMTAELHGQKLPCICIITFESILWTKFYDSSVKNQIKIITK